MDNSNINSYDASTSNPIDVSQTIEPTYYINKLTKIPKIDIKSYILEDDFDIEPYDEGIVKPSGVYGQVEKAFIKSSGIPVILKKYIKYSKNNLIPRDIIREIIIIQHLNQYPETMCVKLYGIAFDREQENLYLVLERLESDLHKITVSYKTRQDKNQGRLPSEQYRKIFYQILKAVNAIHSLGIVHNDIKLNNIMINDQYIRIIDFGLANFLGLGPLKKLVETYLSTEAIKAPDTNNQSIIGYIEGNRKTYVSDMYSIGATMIHMAVRNYFKLGIINNKIHIFNKVNGIYTDKGDQTAYLSNTKIFGIEGYDLLLKIMNHNTNERWCAKQALLHPYFQGLNGDYLIDRTLVGGNMDFYNKTINYTRSQYENKSMELCYLEELYENYKDTIIPIVDIKINNNNFYILHDWILSVLEDTNMIIGIDIIINSLVLLHKNLPIDFSLNNIQTKSILYNVIYEKIFTEYDTKIDEIHYIIDHSNTKKEIIQYQRDIIVNSNGQIEFYPISTILMYILLKLEYEIDTRITPIYGQLYNEMSKNILFIFIHPIVIKQPMTIWELCVYVAIKSLSTLLDVTPLELIDKPLVDWLVISKNKYNIIAEYVRAQEEYVIRNKSSSLGSIMFNTIKNIYGL